MRRTPCLAAVLAASTLTLFASACRPTRWFLVLGQSNAVGTSYQPTEPAPGEVWRVADLALLTRIADPGIHGPNQAQVLTSSWPAFAAHTPGEVGLIAAALGGTCLLDWPWNPGRWHPEAGDLLDRAIAAWHALGSPPIEAALWLQGECDASQALVAGWSPEELRVAYRDTLLALADRVALELETVLVAGTVSTRLCRYENVDCDPALFEAPFEPVVPVVEATLDAVALHPALYPGPDTSDLRVGLDAQGGTGSLHIWDVNELGHRWADSVAALGP
ncbi:MAG: sialate O-acetylesterase [Myxococcota bacterium]